MTSFRFVHAADIHLDSPLKGLSGYDGAAAERIRSACRESFEAVVSLAIDERAAFMIIAGDLYDGDWRDYHTGLFFVGQMARLAKEGIAAFLVYGNHDAESQLTRRLQLPANVRAFSARKPEVIRLKELGVALHGQSFAQRDVSENIALAYPRPVEGAFNIGVLHTGLGGLASADGGAHANYAPCTLQDLCNKGYDYWALGHVHKREVVHERPYVVFPGNVQGRHIRETGPKGAYLVTVEDGEVTGLDFTATDVVRWALVPAAAGGARKAADVIDIVRDAVREAAASEAEGRLLACRVEIRGRCQAHAALTASGDLLLAEARAAALELGEHAAWIEKVVVATESAAGAAPAAREDALGALARMLGEAPEDAELRARLEADIGEMIRKLPYDALPDDGRDDVGDPVLSAAVKGDFAGLIERAGDYLTARLSVDEAAFPET